MRLTEHFTLEELAYTSKKGYDLKNIAYAMQDLDKMQALAEFAERVRDVIGCPMIITSGFRCDELNKAVGGSDKSRHRLCEAIDFIPKNKTIEEAIMLIFKSKTLEYGQLIYEKTKNNKWIHISMGTKKQKLTYSDGIYTVGIDVSTTGA